MMNTSNYVAQLKEKKFSNCLDQIKTIAISGHIHPDGDCVGSCLGLCTYILDHYPDMQVDVYLDPIPKEFTFLKHVDRVRQENTENVIYDLCIALDSSDLDRLNRAVDIFSQAKHTICIDHHITNQGFGDICIVCPKSSSASELIYNLLKETELFGNASISFDCAQALYLGIVHDTGVFRHSNTTLAAMTAAGELVEYGLDTEKIIKESYFAKTYVQNQLLGKALLESILMLDGRMIFSVLYQKDFHFFGGDHNDTNGIVDQLRVTEGINVALFLYENEKGDFKVSMRSDEMVDVSVIAKEFGGGGHVRAAGCTVAGAMRDIVMNIAERVEIQLEEHEKKMDIRTALTEQDKAL